MIPPCRVDRTAEVFCLCGGRSVYPHHLTAAGWAERRMDGCGLPVWFGAGFPSGCPVMLWPCVAPCDHGHDLRTL